MGSGSRRCVVDKWVVRNKREDDASGSRSKISVSKSVGDQGAGNNLTSKVVQDTWRPGKEGNVHGTFGLYGSDVGRSFVDPIALEVGLGPDSVVVEPERCLDPIYMCELGRMTGRSQTEGTPVMSLDREVIVELEAATSKFCDGPEGANEKHDLLVDGPMSGAVFRRSLLRMGWVGLGSWMWRSWLLKMEMLQS